jgi:hypothetical protein
MKAPGPAGENALQLDLGRLSRWVLACCLISEFAFLLLDYHINYGGLDQPGPIRRLSNIAREDGLASWFATVQTLLIGFTALAIHRVVAHQAPGRGRSKGWLAVGFIFIYLAIDDGAQLHERIASAFDSGMDGGAPWVDVFPSYTWQVLFLPVFGLFGLFLLVFLWRELEEMYMRFLLVVAMGTLALAIALDFVEGLEPDHPGNLYSYLDMWFDLDAWTYERFDQAAYDALRHFGKAVEETLEMAAMSLLWFTFLRHLARSARELVVRFEAGI